MDQSGDAAEAAAGRAADVVMRGGPAPALAPVSNGVVQRQRVRTCTRGEESAGATTVTCDDGTEYQVRRVILQGRVPSTQAGATAGLDGSTVFLEVEICRATNRVTIRTEMPLAPPVQRAIENILRGEPAASGVQLDPRMTIGWDLGGFRGTLSGGPIIQEGASQLGGTARVTVPIGPVTGVLEGTVGPTPSGGGPPPWSVTAGVEGTIGRPTRPDCYEVVRTFTYRCSPVTYTPEVLPVLEDDIEAYVFFEYATSTRTGTVAFRRGNVPLPSTTLQDLAHRGYRVRAVYGHTSPEGPRQEPRRRGGFMSNDALGQERAEVAANYIRTECPDCVAGEFPVETRSELYTGDRPRGGELEGDPLTHRAREGFLGRDDGSPDPFATQEDQEALERRSLAQQRDYVYPRLRRAVIHLHRTGVPGLPRSPQIGGEAECPADVISVMRQ